MREQLRLKVQGLIAKPARKRLRYLACQAGAGAMSFAVAVPALLGAIGIASDVAIATMKKSELQALADQAAIAAANELALGKNSADVIQATASSFVDANTQGTDRTITKSAKLIDSTSQVTVQLSEDWTPFFAHFVGFDVTPINVSATAGLAGQTNVCVLALEAKNLGAISMTQSAHMQANNCAIYSNSISSSGVILADNSSIEAQLVCSAGGVKGFGTNTADKVQGDCPALPDPLASRPTPTFGACDFTNFTAKDGVVTLKPGVYCGGLRISGTATATFEPGSYIIKDGPFVISESASANGADVAFYLTGGFSLIVFKDNASINFSGAEDGVMAGLLFFEDPKSSLLRLHTISASRAETLTGTIYLPRGNLVVDPNSTVGAKSAYTAIVARRVIVANGPTLVLNTDYSATSVPVPSGISSAGKVVLTD